MNRRQAFWLISGIAFLSVLLWWSFHPSGQIGISILFGWVSYLMRVLPSVTVSWDGVGIAAFSIIVFSLLVHFFGRWYYRETANDKTTRPGRWRRRWTVAIVVVVLTMFVAGIAMVGVCHQAIWLASDEEPMFESVEQSVGGRHGSSETNLKFMGMAYWNYYDMEQQLPSGGEMNEFGEMRRSWMTEILPFMNYIPEEIDHDLPWNHPKNADAFSSVIPEFINPELRQAPVRDRNGYGVSHYAGNSRVLRPNHRMQPNDFEGGTSNTILAGEVNRGFVAWANPANLRDPANGINKDAVTFGGRRGAEGANFLMVDGEVRFLSEDIDQDVLRALSTPAAESMKTISKAEKGD